MNNDDDIIHSYRWRKLSKKIRERDNNECYICGEYAAAVDHVKSRDKYPELTWDENNLRAICTMHNSIKGNKDTEELRSEWINEDWFTISTRDLVRAKS